LDFLFVMVAERKDHHHLAALLFCLDSIGETLNRSKSVSQNPRCAGLNFANTYGSCFPLVLALGGRVFLLRFVAVFRCLIGVTARYLSMLCRSRVIAGHTAFASFCVML
jgi:hypothetical protein